MADIEKPKKKKAPVAAATAVLKEAEPPKHLCVNCKKEMTKHETWEGKKPGWYCECGYYGHPDWSIPRNFFFNDHVPGTARNLLQNSPGNAVTRAVIESYSHGDRIPEYLQTADQIIEWFERRPPPPKRAFPVSYDRRTERMFSANVEITESESGVCNYSATRYGQQYISIEGEHILDVAMTAAENGWTIKDVLRKLKREIIEEPPDIETSRDEDSVEFTDYDAKDIESSSINVTLNEQELRQFIENEQPDTLMALDDNVEQ